ncbi:mycofactocin biosynthesis chaperone MftB [Patulibacter sp. S7RM1-6]
MSDPPGGAGAADAVAAPRGAFDASRPWALSPQVALRPERFGALAYHFGTRRLSFLKSPRLLAVVEALADHPTAEAACAAVGITPAELPAMRTALGTLARTDMIVPRTSA